MNSVNLRAISIVIAVSSLHFAGICSRVASQTRTRAGIGAQKTSSTADGMLALANFFYKNNDISDKADRYYKQVIVKYPGTRAAGLAQYNRGAYWHSKYNILREQKREGIGKSALVEAEGQYYDFIDKFAKNTNTLDLLSDAQFNLALVYLQKEKRATAVGWLNVLLTRATEDNEIYIYRVVWSSNPSDVIDRKFRSTELALFARDIMGRGDLSTDQIISQIKQWCRNH